MATKATTAAKSTKSTSKATAATKANKAPKAATKVAKLPKAPQKATGKPTNPFREGSNYGAIYTALYGKGILTFAQLKKGIQIAMGPANWKAFATKKGQNENAKDCDARLHQNVCVLQRADYGKPLHDMGLMIVKEKATDGGWSYSMVKSK